jgi:hypothetical protein
MTSPGLPPIGISPQTTGPAPAFGASSPTAEGIKGKNITLKKDKSTLQLKSAAEGDTYQASVDAKQYEVVTGDIIKGAPGTAKEMIGLKDKKTGISEFYMGGNGEQQLFATVDKTGNAEPTDKSTLKTKDGSGSKVDVSA